MRNERYRRFAVRIEGSPKCERGGRPKKIHSGAILYDPTVSALRKAAEQLPNVRVVTVALAGEPYQLAGRKPLTVPEGQTRIRIEADPRSLALLWQKAREVLGEQG